MLKWVEHDTIDIRKEILKEKTETYMGRIE